MSYDREAYKQKQKETRGRIKEILNDFIPKLVVSPDEIDQYMSGFEGFYHYSLLNQCIAAYEYYATTGRQAEMFATYSRWKETRGRIKEILNDFIPKLVVSPDEIDQYLSGFEGFYQYSLLNQCIAAYEYYATTGRQAEMFATYSRWKEHGRFVKKGERAVHMIRPVRYTVEIENQDGEIEEEEKLTFKPFCVFDIQSTGGKPLVDNDLIKGKSVMSYEEIKAVVEKEFKVFSSPLEIERGATNGEWIRVSEKSSENYKISTILHEVAHNKLGHFERDVEKPKEELEAECCAYIVTSLLGLDNRKSRLYIANWNPKDAQEAVKERATLILKTAEEIYKTITANNHQLKLV